MKNTKINSTMLFIIGQMIFLWNDLQSIFFIFFILFNHNIFYICCLIDYLSLNFIFNRTRYYNKLILFQKILNILYKINTVLTTTFVPNYFIL